jgi:hypothetical protein
MGRQFYVSIGEIRRRRCNSFNPHRYLASIGFFTVDDEFAQPCVVRFIPPVIGITKSGPRVGRAGGIDVFCPVLEEALLVRKSALSPLIAGCALIGITGLVGKNHF